MLKVTQTDSRVTLRHPGYLIRNFELRSDAFMFDIWELGKLQLCTNNKTQHTFLSANLDNNKGQQNCCYYYQSNHYIDE